MFSRSCIHHQRGSTARGWRPYIVHAKHIAQCVGIIGHYSAAIDEAHALWGRLRGRGILYAAPELFDRGGSGDVCEVHTTLEIRRG